MILLYPGDHSAIAEEESTGQLACMTTITLHHPLRDGVSAQLHRGQGVMKVR